MIKFNFAEKEFGWSEVIATGALIFSAVSFWHTINANKPLVIQGSGFANVAIEENRGKCLLLASLPVEYENSGKTSVKLTKFTSENRVLRFVLGTKELDSSSIPYQTVLTSHPLYWHTAKWLDDLSVNSVPFEKNMGLHNGFIISPNSRFSTNLAVIVELTEPRKKLADFMAINFTAHFSNGQQLEFSSVISIPTKVQCNG